MSKDYYSILGVAKGASQDEIKKAFREKAHLYHPDKPTGNDAKFKEANEAYQVLGDEQKRKQYDQFGSDAGQGGFGGASGFNWQDFAQGQAGGMNFDVNDLGDLFGDFFGMGGRSASRGPKVYRGEDIQVNLALQFKESVFGVKKEVSIDLFCQCETCFGTGGEKGSEQITCSVCKGSGQIVTMKKTFLGTVQSVASCATCEGRGKYYEKKCKLCHGSGRTKKRQNITLDIPAGIEPGMTIKMNGKGNIGQLNGPAGDLYLEIDVVPDLRFVRRNDNILTKIEIPFSMAVLGGKIDVETMDGKESQKIPVGMVSGTEFTIKGKGVPRFQRSGRGDMIITVQVKVPKDLTREQRELLKQLEEAGL